MIENRLLTHFNNVIRTQWSSKQIEVAYEPLIPKQLFELAYHTANSVGMRNIFIKQSSNETKEGSQTVFYSNTKKFTFIEALNNGIRLIKYFPEGTTGDKLLTEVKPKLERFKLSFSSKDSELKSQILKIILVERKLDQGANYVMLNEINRKVYFTIGDARESAAVVPIFMEAEGSSLVQLALNKWMTTVQTLDQEKPFPDNLIPGLLKNLMQIKKWVLNLVDTLLDK